MQVAVLVNSLFQMVGIRGTVQEKDRYQTTLAAPRPCLVFCGVSEDNALSLYPSFDFTKCSGDICALSHLLKLLFLTFWCLILSFQIQFVVMLKAIKVETL